MYKISILENGMVRAYKAESTIEGWCLSDRVYFFTQDISHIQERSVTIGDDLEVIYVELKSGNVLTIGLNGGGSDIDWLLSAWGECHDTH